jgi:hypothetical protein
MDITETAPTNLCNMVLTFRLLDRTTVAQDSLRPNLISGNRPLRRNDIAHFMAYSAISEKPVPMIGRVHPRLLSSVTFDRTAFSTDR